MPLELPVKVTYLDQVLNPDTLSRSEVCRRG
jgi:hypothetical protein